MNPNMPEQAHDQAAGLRRLTGLPRPVKVIAVASGKGGVGKTSISVNLAVSMAQQGKQVLLLDADLGLANVDVLLGINARRNLSHVIAGEASLGEVIVEGPAGLRIVPSASGTRHMLNLSTAEQGGLIRAFSELHDEVDVMVVDIAAGLNESVITFTRAAHEVVVVVCDEPASLTDAYALIKVLNRHHGVDRFHILANMIGNAHEGRQLFDKLARVSQRFLDVTLGYMGAVPYDDYLRKAVQRQLAVVEAYPRSRSALAFRKMVDRTERWPVPQMATGRLEFFVERLLRSGTVASEFLSWEPAGYT
ncbi:MAG: MinD/ParA family protein [Gammaproteobacteria bacterium]|jgi:flagellar biosynthesis protein FlhG